MINVKLVNVFYSWWNYSAHRTLLISSQASLASIWYVRQKTGVTFTSINIFITIQTTHALLKLGQNLKSWNIFQFCLCTCIPVTVLANHCVDFLSWILVDKSHIVLGGEEIGEMKISLEISGFGMACEGFYCTEKWDD